MRKLVEAMLDDLSTREVFLFQTRCDECGREYKSKPLRFSKAGVMPQTQEKLVVYDAVYEQEIRAARQCFPIYFPLSGGTRCHDLRFLNVEL